MAKHESSASGGWLNFFSDDRTEASARRRLVIALAAAIALHEIVAAFVPRSIEQTPVEARVRAETIRVVVRQTPRPTPRPIVTPTPQPTPTPIPKTLHIATPRPAAPIQHAARRGGGQAAAPVARVVRSTRLASSGGAGTHTGRTGTGSGPGAGSGAGPGAGTGRRGSGTGTQAHNGGGAGNLPCGFVDFVNFGSIEYNRSDHKFYHNIRLRFHLRDGTLVVYPLDYKWVYNSEAEDPWSDQNIKKTDEIAMQKPPPEKLPYEPDVVKYIVAHTSPEGYLLMDPCPGQGP